jgi:hypothetical protein
VVLAVVFVLGVSFGMYFEKKASTGSSSSSGASSKQVLLQQQQQQQQQQQGGQGCEALIRQAEVDRDETWQETVGQLQVEIKQASSDISKMVHPHRIPADCMARLGPQVDGRLFDPSATEEAGEQEVARAMAQESGEGEAGDAEKEMTAAAAAAGTLRKRLVRGMAVNLMPCRKGSSMLSRLRYAWPPTGCRLDRVSSCRRQQGGAGLGGRGTAAGAARSIPLPNDSQRWQGAAQRAAHHTL